MPTMGNKESPVRQSGHGCSLVILPSKQHSTTRGKTVLSLAQKASTVASVEVESKAAQWAARLPQSTVTSRYENTWHRPQEDKHQVRHSLLQHDILHSTSAQATPEQQHASCILCRLFATCGRRVAHFCSLPQATTARGMHRQHQQHCHRRTQHPAPNQWSAAPTVSQARPRPTCSRRASNVPEVGIQGIAAPHSLRRTRAASPAAGPCRLRPSSNGQARLT